MSTSMKKVLLEHSFIVCLCIAYGYLYGVAEWVATKGIAWPLVAKIFTTSKIYTTWLFMGKKNMPKSKLKTFIRKEEIMKLENCAYSSYNRSN